MATSSPKVARVLRGFASLSQQERQEFVDEANKYISGADQDKRTLSEGFEKTAIRLGPLGGACGCCGK